MNDESDPQRRALPEFEIRPRSGWSSINFAELWEHRELLGFLVSREIKVRYKQTVLGLAWAVIQPVLAMLIFTVIFGRFASFPSEGAPYPVFVYLGLIPWTFFSSGVTQAGQSLANQQALLTKIYLPRLFIPAAPLGAAMVDLAISFGVFAILLMYYQCTPGWGVIVTPVILLLLIMAALGVSLLLAALTVTYRDFRYVIPFMMQVWMYVSPVIYPLEMVPKEQRWLFSLNPLAGIIDGMRAAFLARPFDWPNLGISAATSTLLLLWGALYFKKTERRFADIA